MKIIITQTGFYQCKDCKLVETCPAIVKGYSREAAQCGGGIPTPAAEQRMRALREEVQQKIDSLTTTGFEA